MKEVAKKPDLDPREQVQVRLYSLLRDLRLCRTPLTKTVRVVKQTISDSEAYPGLGYIDFLNQADYALQHLDILVKRLSEQCGPAARKSVQARRIRTWR